MIKKNFKAAFNHREPLRSTLVVSFSLSLLISIITLIQILLSDSNIHVTGSSIFYIYVELLVDCLVFFLFFVGLYFAIVKRFMTFDTANSNKIWGKEKLAKYPEFVRFIISLSQRIINFVISLVKDPVINSILITLLISVVCFFLWIGLDYAGKRTVADATHAAIGFFISVFIFIISYIPICAYQRNKILTRKQEDKNQ